MDKLIKIARKDIKSIEIYINSAKKNVSQIALETGADYVITGTFYNGAWEAVCHVKKDGVVIANDPSYEAYGYAWNDVNSFGMVLLPPNGGSYKNYYTCCQLVKNYIALDPLYYNPDVAGSRGRTAIAETPTDIYLYACTYGEESITPENLRDKFSGLGVRSAVMNDGGGKVNFVGQSTIIQGGQKSQNLILIYLNKSNTGNIEEEKYDDNVMADNNLLVYIDPGHGGTDTYNGSPDGTYKEHEFTLDVGLQVAEHLKRCGVGVKMTRSTNTTVSLTNRATMANNDKATIFVSIHSNASGSEWSNASGLCVYTYAEGGERDVLAKSILSAVKESGVINTFSSELYHANFTVLSKTTMPACLIESGFCTNKTDVEKLKSADWRKEYSKAVAKGIVNYLGVKWVEDSSSIVDTDNDEEETQTPSTPTTSTHWAQANFDNLVARGVQLIETRFDDNITRGEAFALADKILTALGK